VRFEPLPPPTQGEVERLLRGVHHRVLRLLEKRGALPAQGPEDALQAYQAHSLQQRLRWTEVELETIVKERGISIAATAGNRRIAPSGSDQNPAPSVGWRASGCGATTPGCPAPGRFALTERVDKPLFCLHFFAKKGFVDAAGGLGAAGPQISQARVLSWLFDQQSPRSM